jgi:hypothetical protein
MCVTSSASGGQYGLSRLIKPIAKLVYAGKYGGVDATVSDKKWRGTPEDSRVVVDLLTEPGNHSCNVGTNTTG